MRVVHEPDESSGSGELPGERVLATEVEVADSTLSMAKGLMFRSEVPEEFALVMDVGGDSLMSLSNGPSRQFVHMLCMRFPIDVLWLHNSEVVKNARLTPWVGGSMAKADCIIELPAGNAEGVTAGDTVRIDDCTGESGE